MKKRININFDFSNILSYTFITIIMLLVVGVGVYAYTTDNSGTPSLFGHSADELEVDVFPTGAVMYFNLGSCPSGWSELTIARGRYVVGSYGSAGVGDVVGDDLTGGEDRATGMHSHGINDPGHSHLFARTFGSGAGYYLSLFLGSSRYDRGTSSATTGISINDAGSVPGTNAPYIQLLVCQKD